MANVTNRPAEIPELSGYPTYAEALAYAENFRRGAGSAYRKFNDYAAFQHSPSMKVAVRRLHRRVYEVRAYSVNGFDNSILEKPQVEVDFRAWLLTYDSNSRRWACFLDSQSVSRMHFINVKRSIRRHHSMGGLSLRLIELTRHSLPIQPIYSERGHLITR